MYWIIGTRSLLHKTKDFALNLTHSALDHIKMWSDKIILDNVF